MIDKSTPEAKQELDLQCRFEIYLACSVVDIIKEQNIDIRIDNSATIKKQKSKNLNCIEKQVYLASS